MTHESIDRMLMRPPRFRLTRVSLVTLLLSGFTFYYLFLRSDGELPEELIASKIYHPASTSPKSGKWPKSLGRGNGEEIGLEYGDDGLVRGWDTAHELLETVNLPKRERKKVKEVRETHPIETLMAKGKERWEALLKSQSKTLPQAVTEYTRRYNRAPPKGFEVWWQFCKKHGVKIVDDYDQINRDIEPYFAISPIEFQHRLAKLDTQEHSYQIFLSPTATPSMTGPRVASPRGRHLFHLLTPLSTYLPTDLKITVSDHDMGNWLLGDEQLRVARRAVKHGMYLTTDELKVFEKKEARGEVKGMMSACGKGTRGWNETIARQRGIRLPEEEVETRFIHDPSPTYDLCSNPSLRQTHGSHSYDFPRESILRPLFQLSKFSRDPSFLTTPLEAYFNHTSSITTSQYSPWAEKTISKLFWRGTSTGDHYSHRKDYDWRNSHRVKLHFMSQAAKGAGTKAEDVGIWVKRGREWEWEEWAKSRVGEVYMDVGLTGKPHQCSQDDGTCDEMANEIEFKGRVRPEESVQYKYALDVDGNGWSSRFHRLLMSGSMVIKATIYREWQSDLMIPWYHYVPTQIDYSDLYSILSFFIGPPDGRKGGNDHLAQQIAEQGRQFAIEHWRWEDMQAYMLRLLLEFARLQADDREEFSYKKTYT